MLRGIVAGVLLRLRGRPASLLELLCEATPDLFNAPRHRRDRGFEKEKCLVFYLQILEICTDTLVLLFTLLIPLSHNDTFGSARLMALYS